MSLTTACVLPPAQTVPPPPADPQPKFYVASVEAASERAASIDDGFKVLDERATEILRSGIKVAFFPPDRCRNISAAATNATTEQAEMANDCGVLISSLETAVAGRYSVVSWQTLKGPDPFSRAEDREVDVIFEVDSFGTNSMGTDAQSAINIEFFEQSDAEDRAPLMLNAEELAAVGPRCKAWADETETDRERSGAVGSFTGAIKAVEVSSGQALLYYQRTLTDDPGASGEDRYERYFESRGRIDYRPPAAAEPQHNALQKGGVAALVAGSVSFAVGVPLRATFFRGTDVDSDGIKEFRQPGTEATGALSLVGGLLIAGGVTMLVFGNRKARRDIPPPLEVSIPPAAYTPPSAVLCGRPTTPPWLAPVPGAPASGGPETSANSISFSESHTAGRDTSREHENKLRKLVIEDFTRSLIGLGK